MKSVIIYSGGLDSTVLLHNLAKENSVVEAVSIDYGQRHSKELAFAKKNCENLGINFNLVDLSNLNPLFGKSALTDVSVDVPEAQYASENIAITVVPNRNMIMLAVASARAMALNADAVSYAAHSGDHALYPDCTNEFADAMAKAIRLADYAKIELLRPFIEINKAQIVKLGADLGVDFSNTWSCYKGGKKHCGKCATCIERRQAFIDAGVFDPTEYDF